MKELFLLGSGRSADVCSFDGTEIWATARILPRMAPPTDCSKVFAVGNPYKSRKGLSIARENNIPIVSTEDYATEKFPFDEIVKRFKLGYLRCTLTYMLAYALYLGYEKLWLFGMDINDEFDQDADKPRITYWLGVARGMGVEWELTPGTRLFAVMQQTVKRRYAVKEYQGKLKHSAFLEEAMRHGDPYCFVSGIDTDAITVTGYRDGKEVTKWHP